MRTKMLKPLLGMLLPFLLIITLAGCSSTIELLDGLCFNEKEGTYLCPSENDCEVYTVDTMGQNEKLYEYCER